MADWDKAIFGLLDVRILIYLKQRNAPTRYSELLTSVAGSRGSLATSLTQLQKMGLISRSVKDVRPVATEYTLTEKGSKVVQLLLQLKQFV